MGIEGFKRQVATPEIEKRMRDSLRESIFGTLVAGKVLDTFEDELFEAGFDDATLEEIESAFAALPENDKRAVLSIPAQLRPGLFERYHGLVARGRVTGAGMIAEILAHAKERGYTLGFHLSPVDIRPDKDGAWIIRGTEKDHRHDDRTMAYYSTDYTHRYLRKPTRFLYVVRAETDENSSHYPDNDGSWGHASSLSIIEKVDMPELESEMDRQLAEMEGKSKGDA